MKFKIELEAVTPREKALTPIMKLEISSKYASPDAVRSVLEQLRLIIWSLENAIDKLHENENISLEGRA